MNEIREVISIKEFKRLKAYVTADDKLRKASKENLLRTFTLLYYSGCRLNELQQFTLRDIKEIIEQKDLIIYTKKVKKERKILFTDSGVKEISKLFSESLESEPSDTLVIKKRGSAVLNQPINDKVFLREVNKVIQACLGDRYSSHSFRGGYITELANAKVNPKLIQKFIGHSDIKTTMRYINPSDDDIRSALTR